MRSRRVEIVSIFCLLVFTAAVYLPAVGHSFVADDSSQILANTHIHSASYIPVYFTGNVWAQIALAPGEHPAAYYRPVFLLWLLLNYSLFGYSAVWWHASAVLLHLAATLLVYLLAKKLLRDWRIALGAALLFGLHPVHIEAVDWVSGASEPLAALPFLGAALCYIEAARAPRHRLWMAASLGLYFVALLAKETAIVLPGVLIAYDLLLRAPPQPLEATFSKDGRKIRALARRIAGFVPVVAVYWAMRMHALAGIHVNALPFTTLLYTWPAAVWFYISHLLFPVRLSFFYNLAYIASFRAAAVLVPLALVAMFLAAVALWARGRPLAAFAAVWAVLTILPPLDLAVFLRYELVHDRYLYLPSVGFCILVALALSSAAARFQARRQIAFACMAAIAVVYAALTLNQSRYWSDEATLFTRSFQIGNHNWSAERNYAYAVARSGHCDEVLPLIQAFTLDTPDDSKATFALGSCYFHLQHWADAERLMLRTAHLQPHYQQPYLVLAAIRLQQGRVGEADQAWRNAVQAQGANEELSLHYVHGEILKAQGDLLDAAEEFRKELQVQPGNREILEQLASVGGSY